MESEDYFFAYNQTGLKLVGDSSIINGNLANAGSNIRVGVGIMGRTKTPTKDCTGIYMTKKDIANINGGGFTPDVDISLREANGLEIKLNKEFLTRGPE